MDYKVISSVAIATRLQLTAKRPAAAAAAAAQAIHR